MKGFATTKSGSGTSGRKSGGTVERGKCGDRACLQELNSLARRSLRDLVLFIIVSAAFFHLRHFDVMALPTEGLRVVLGCPPPAALSTAALIGYSISAAVLILARTCKCARPQLTWSHFGFRIVFYLFFMLSQTLTDHFMEVFIAGILLYGFEHLNLWTYSRAVLPRNRKILENF